MPALCQGDHPESSGEASLFGQRSIIGGRGRPDHRARARHGGSPRPYIECVRRTSLNVKRWQSGDMALRWTAPGMLEAERQFRRVIGYRDLAKLAVAIERDLSALSVPSVRVEEVAPTTA